VVEDDLTIMHHVAEELARDLTWASPIRQFRDGRAAVALLDEGFVPDLVMLCLEPAAVGGLHLLQRLHLDARYRYTAVVVAGASADAPVDHGRTLPGEVRLPKPFQMDDLVMAIRLALARLVESYAMDMRAQGL
jgi:DNA-binding response OmpR family regulator